MDQIDLDSIPASALNYSSRHLLGQFLNPRQNLLSKDGFSRDYHGLAEQMDFQYNTVRNFERSEDITMKILEAWTTEEDATIGKLIRFLKNMGRHDVIEDMQSWFEKDVKVYLKSLESKKENPVQVPEVTSCRTQISTTSDLHVLTREDVATGESTLYDAYISYADEDIEFVFNLARKLESLGFKLFIRSRDLLAGHSEYETNMELIKSRCKRVLIVLSPAFINCPACEVQAGFAASFGFEERCRKIIPILWKSCEIPLIIKFISRIDFTKLGVQEWIWDQLVSSLRDVTSPTFITSRSASPGRCLFPQAGPPPIESSSPDTSSPAITFPPTEPHSRKNSETCIEAAEESLTSKVSASTSKPKTKLSSLRNWMSKSKAAKKEDTDSSASNATSGFHSQSGNVFESSD